MPAGWELGYRWSCDFQHQPPWHPTYRNHKYFQSLLLPGACQQIPSIDRRVLKTALKTQQPVLLGRFHRCDSTSGVNKSLFCVNGHLEPREKALARQTTLFQKHGQVLAGSMGLLNAPMSNPDPRMKCGPRRTLGKGVLLLRTPSGPS